MKSFKERYGGWALVTGGTSGIGKQLVRQVAAGGMNLVIVARTRSSLDTEAASVTAEFGVEVRTVAADLTTAGGSQAVIDAVSDLEIGLLIPCAAIEDNGYFVDTPLDRQLQLVTMDVVSPMMLVHHFGKAMAERRRGGVLLVASLSGWMPQPYMAHYGAAKAYVLSLGQSLHHEMKDRGVDVAVLSPGPTDTPMAANTGIDFGSMGMAVMKPTKVAATGLAALGRKPDAVPGFRNGMMLFMMRKLMPLRWVGGLFKRMMGKALKIDPAKAARVALRPPA